MTATAVYDAAQALLVAASHALTISAGGPASRVYVSPAVPPWDQADQLTVHIGAAVQGDTLPLQPALQPMQRISGARLVPLVQMTVTILRAVPYPTEDGTAPTEAELDEAAQVMTGDLWAVWNWLATAKRNGDLFPPHTRELIFDPAIPANEQGGIAGWQIPVRVQVDGFKAY